MQTEQAINLLSKTLINQTPLNYESKAVIAVVQQYARSWSLLQGYDEQKQLMIRLVEHFILLKD